MVYQNAGEGTTATTSEATGLGGTMNLTLVRTTLSFGSIQRVSEERDKPFVHVLVHFEAFFVFQICSAPRKSVGHRTVVLVNVLGRKGLGP